MTEKTFQVSDILELQVSTACDVTINYHNSHDSVMVLN